jgi:hypothetical protein
VARAGYALNRPERWNSNLDGVTFGAGAEFFEKVAHGSCELRLISRPHGCDGLQPLLRLYLSAHWFILA